MKTGGIAIYYWATLSGCGSQYLWHKMVRLNRTFGLKQSMSSIVDLHEEVWNESFWVGPTCGRMKAELNMLKDGYEGLDKL